MATPFRWRGGDAWSSFLGGVVGLLEWLQWEKVWTRSAARTDLGLPKMLDAYPTFAPVA